MTLRTRNYLLVVALAAMPVADSRTALAQSDVSAGDRAENALRDLEQRGPIANPYRAGRAATLSRKGIVASSHVLASQAGLDLLRAGGSAIDAAVATAATLAVVEPMMTGLGGDVWVLYFEAQSGKIFALNGSGRSPVGLERRHFRDRGLERVPGKGWESVTVPGAVDAWATVVDRFGSKELGEILAPAIRYAEEGYAVTETVARMWKSMESGLKIDPWARKSYLVDDRAPRFAEVFKNPDLARSLRQIAEGGRDAFYRGPIAEEIVRYARESGGYLTMEDFAAHHSDWMEPLSVDYRGYRVYQCPPNSQGIAALLMLNLLEGFDLASMKLNSADYLHLLIEAKKLAYADTYALVADPDRSSIPIERMLSEQYAAERRALINPQRAAVTVTPGLMVGTDTVYLTAIDSRGNAVSFINSLYNGFGSGIVGGSTGIMLQDRGAGFTLEEGHPNEYAAGKRPFHTLLAGMVTHRGKLYMSYGLMGGAMQPQGHVQFLLAHLDFGLGLQEAVDMPRWRHYSGARVGVEHGTPRATMDGLRALGHDVVPSSGGSYGGAQAILVDPVTGTYVGASDPRKDGAALGY